MSAKRIAANGQELTEGMMDRWCAAYERGEFPEGERTVGEVVYGRPPLSDEGSVTFSIKIPRGMKAAIKRRAQSEGVSMGAFVRSALTDKLLVGA